MLYILINMRILKLIAIGIIEKKAENELSRLSVSLANRLNNGLDKNDFDEASAVYGVLKLREGEIKEWKDRWVGRIEKL